MTDFTAKRTWGPTPAYPKVLAYKNHTWWPYDGGLAVLAGPCTVETIDQMERVIRVLAKNNVTYARGGVYRAGTYPGDQFGFKPGLALEWSTRCHDAGLKVVMECLDIRLLGELAMVADAIQIGARHMQDYALLREAAKLDCPVFLKRNPGATLDEFLGAAEYLCRGACKPVLIERGSSTHENQTRWTLSVSMIAAIKKITGIPILVDASHGTGRRDLVHALTMSGVAAGADGFLIEVHPEPEKSLSDSEQAYPLEGLADLMEDANSLYKLRTKWKPR